MAEQKKVEELSYEQAFEELAQIVSDLEGEQGSLEEALAFVDALRSQPGWIPISPGGRHWEIFTRLCRESNARGNLVPDAYLAALAIESGSEWITTDRDFRRFSGLRWSSPEFSRTY